MKLLDEYLQRVSILWSKNGRWRTLPVISASGEEGKTGSETTRPQRPVVLTVATDER